MADIAKERDKIVFAGAASALLLRKFFKNRAKELVQYVESLPLDLDERKLLARSQRMALSRANSLLSGLFKEAHKQAEIDLKKVLDRIARLQISYLRNAGVKGITEKELASIQKQVLKLLRAEFPKGTGLSYFDRIDRIKKLHLQQTKSMLARSFPQEKVIQGISRDLENGWSYSKPARTPVRGGSAVKKFQRLVVAEENRLAREVELQVIKKSGINFSYWRLNASHKWEGGKEICEVHSQETGIGVVSALHKLRINPDDVELDGLHLLEDWPDYPHPFCACFPEPLVL